MARMTPSEFARQAGTGLLSFPVTCFKDDLSVDEAKYREHVAWLGEHKVAGLFAAGGTGEFFSLSLGEVEKVVHAGVAETGGRMPVIAANRLRHGDRQGAWRLQRNAPAEVPPDGVVNAVSGRADARAHRRRQAAG
jgi:Dihydrodipicolinate synthetase family